MDATKKNEQLKKQLSAATCALLGAVPMAQAADSEKSWSVDTSVLHYQEADNRVTAIEPTIDLNKKFNGGKEAHVKLTVDVLTGATPNGATPTNKPKTFTRPSGNGSYTVQPGETPLDDTFHDTRFAANASWKQPISRLSLLTVGVNGSKEFDFFSLGANAQISRDFNDKNTTLSFGLSTEMDQVDPVGGKPEPFAAMQPVGSVQPKSGGDSKQVLDALVGITQVMNRRWITQLNYSLSSASGYLNDPYKVLSRIDSTSGATIDNVYESRPDSRNKHAIFWLNRLHLKRDVVSMSYRYFFDDWGVKSHTVDVNYNWKFSERQYLEPRFRFYSQTAADFYHVSLISGAPLPTEASADYRLAKFNGFTYGLKWGLNMKNGQAFIVRIEYYTQIGDSHPDTAVGLQKDQDLYPDLKATILQLQYRF